MHAITTLFKREFAGYFRTPVAYVFLGAFLLTATGLTFFVGQFFEARLAHLQPFFQFLPWIFVPFIPAVGMRLWAEEKRSGSVELLFTLPVTTGQAVAAKFLAAWAFIGIALLLTFPLPLVLAFLGEPDWGVVVTGYLGAWLMSAAYLGLCSLASSLTKNQVISFVLGLFVCLVLVLVGWSVFRPVLETCLMGWLGLPVGMVDALENFSFSSHYDTLQRGLIELRGILYFASVAFVSLLLNALVLER